MNKILRRLCSLALSLFMVLSFVPAISFAEAATYTLVDAASEGLSAGTYLIRGFSTNTIDTADSAFMSISGATGTRLMSADLAISNNQVSTDDTDAVWELIAVTGGFQVKSVATGDYLYYGNNSGNNIYHSTDAANAGVWAFVNDNGTLRLQEVASGRQLSCNRFGSEGSYYFGFAAYKTSSSCARALEFYKLDAGGTEEPEPTYMTIAEARALAVGETANVCGIVTFIDGRNVYIQDSTGGIDLYLNSGTVPAELAIGDEVYGTGTVAEYRGLIELSGIDGGNEEAFGVLSTGNELPLATKTIAEILADASTGALESTRVKIEGVTIGAVNTSGNTPISDGTNSINIYRIPALESIAEGDTVDVIAVISDYNGYQLRVAAAADVTLHEESEYMTIAEARALAVGETANVCGIVTFIDGRNVYIQDSTGGIDLYLNSGTVPTTLARGDKVYGVGTIAEFRGLIEVSGIDGANTEAFGVLSTGNELPLATKTLAEILADASTGALESTRVKIEGVTIGEINTSGNTPISDGTNSINIYRVPELEGIAEGDTVDVIAVISDYNGYQLRVAVAEDVTLVSGGEIVEPEFITIAEARRLGAGNTATVQGVVTFVDGKNVYIQDDTAGIDVYLSANASVAVGTKVQVSGSMTEYRGLLEFNGVDPTDAAQFSMVGTVDTLPIAVTTLADLLANEANDAFQLMESTRVKIYGLTVESVNYGGNTTVKDAAGNSINIYKLPQAEDFTIAAGDVINVTAIVSCFNSYQLRVVEAEDAWIVSADPIETIPEGAVSIADALAAESGEMTVVGQLVYRYGNYDSVNTSIIADVVNGEIVALQIYDSMSAFEIGDIISVTATRGAYGGVPQLSSVSATSVIAEAADVELIRTQPFAYIGDMLAEKADLLSEIMHLREVTLGEYSSNGTTMITDRLGKTIGIYRASTYPAGITAGTTLDVEACLSAYNNNSQLRGVAYIAPDTIAPVITFPDPMPDAEVGRDYTVAIDISDNTGVAESHYTYTINGVTNPVVSAELVPELNSVTGKYMLSVPGSEIVAGTVSIEFNVWATDEGLNRGEAEATAAVIDLPQIISVVPADNTATNEDLRPVVTVEFANAGDAPTAVLTLGDNEYQMSIDGSFATWQADADMAEGKYEATVTIVRSEDSANAQHEWTFTVGVPKYELYFGQLHSHTAQYSDGAGTLSDAYEHVLGLSEYDNVDFLAVTDHSNYFDSASNLGTMDNAASGTQGQNGSLWQEAKATTSYYNSLDSEHVFFYGYEMTWSGGPGHINTFNTVGFVSRNNATLNNKVDDAGMKAYYDLLVEYSDTISQFNHPGKTFGTFADFSYWTEERNEAITMVEVGNGEGAIGGSAYWPSYEYYTMALDKGWHVAPTNNQDNHKGNWGNSNTARNVILTDNFTEEGIYQAMRERAMYSTEDHNLEIIYTLNGLKLGSIIESGVPEKADISVSIADPDGEAIGRVSVIVNGGITIYSESFTESEAVMTAELDADYGYYYIRIDQADGDIAVTAPIWIEDNNHPIAVSAEKDTVMDIMGEPINITTTVTNNDVELYNISSVVYSVQVGQNDFEVLETLTDVEAVASAAQSNLVYEYVPTATGKQVFKVEVFGTIGEEAITWNLSTTVELDVYDGDKLINVAIDSGHANFYVTGNYAGSDAAFIELCAQNGIRVHYIDVLTEDALKDMALLVMTVPFRSYGTDVSDVLYTADELAAVAAYAENGGNIIICSKSDRGNPNASVANDPQHADIITNGILEAIGAESRMLESIVVDNVEKENEAYRLYFTEEYNYNYDSWFVEGVLETTNNSFSCYNGGAIQLGENATEIIRGYETTWATRYEGVFSGSAYVPVYETDPVVKPYDEVVVMASEELSGGGWLLLSGVTFFSTFEVKVEVENAGTLQNSNYQIVMNIINALTPVTPIAEVNEAEEGDRFKVEGIVTSNASGFDQDTAFFDCIYIQDETGGINLFPVDGDFQIGQKVRVKGTVGFYNGERELIVSEIMVIDEELNPVDPLTVTAEQAMAPENTGMLMQVSGTVAEIGLSSDGAIETIMVEDETGLARVFIDGYIMPNYDGLDEIRVGDSVSAIGIGSVTVDTASAEEVFIPRLRVRNRSEIVYEHNAYTVNFIDELTGEIIESFEVDHGGSVEAPEAPEHEGYEFTGWRIEVNGVEDENATLENVTCNMDCYATYEVIYYTVNFIDELTGNMIESFEVAHGDGIDAPEAPEHSGYEFTGWRIEVNGVEDENATLENVTCDMDCYAMYEVIYHTVNFIDDLTGEIIATYEVEHGDSVEGPAAPEHDGYEFVGWRIAMKGTNVSLENVICDMDCYAMYEAIYHTVTFVDGMTEEVIATQDVQETMFAEAPEAPAHDGYTFIGWTVDGEFVNVEAYPVMGEVTFVAEYSRNLYYVFFNTNLDANYFATFEVAEGESFTEFPEAPVVEGYVFTGDYEVTLLGGESHVAPMSGVHNITENILVTYIYEEAAPVEPNDPPKTGAMSMTAIAVAAIVSGLGAIALRKKED